MYTMFFSRDGQYLVRVRPEDGSIEPRSKTRRNRMRRQYGTGSSFIDLSTDYEKLSPDSQEYANVMASLGDNVLDVFRKLDIEMSKKDVNKVTLLITCTKKYGTSVGVKINDKEMDFANANSVSTIFDEFGEYLRQ